MKRSQIAGLIILIVGLVIILVSLWFGLPYVGLQYTSDQWFVLIMWLWLIIGIILMIIGIIYLIIGLVRSS